MNTSTTIRGIQRPTWITKTTKQRFLVLRDVSGSMTGEKADNASKACAELFECLADPVNQDGFIGSIIDFFDTAELTHDFTLVSFLNGKVKPIEVKGSTNITAALELAEKKLKEEEEKKQNGITYLRPVIILFSDGCHNVGPDPDPVADRLKKIADIVTVGYGHDADEKMLRRLATPSQHYYCCKNGAELRTFMAHVGDVMSTTRAAGINATQALENKE